MTTSSLSRNWGTTKRTGAGILGALILLAIWQVTAMTGVFGSGLPTVTATLGALWGLFKTLSFWQDTAATVINAVLGLAIAAVIGIIGGILAGLFPIIRSSTIAIVEFLKPIPPIVVLPLGVMILGPNSRMAILLVVLGCAISIFIQTMAGVQDTDPVALDTARSYGLSMGETIFRVVLPSALPFIGTAIRIAAPVSLVVIVVAGLLGGGPGLGLILYQAQQAGLTAMAYAIVLMLGVLGMIANWTSIAAERYLLHWHPSYRKVSQ